MARPQLTAQSNDLNKHSLIEAAYDICMDSGEQRFSLRKVAQHANVSHTYLYRYFSDKESLLTAVRIRCIKDFFAYILEQDNPSASPVERIKRTLHLMHEYAVSNPHNYSIMFTIDQPPLHKYPELEAARHELFNFAVELSRQASEQGAIKGDYFEFTHVAWATIHGLISLDATHNFNLGKSIDELKQATWKLFFNQVST